MLHENVTIVSNTSCMRTAFMYQCYVNHMYETLVLTYLVLTTLTIFKIFNKALLLLYIAAVLLFIFKVECMANRSEYMGMLQEYMNVCTCGTRGKE